jgi:hypothetical protein
MAATRTVHLMPPTPPVSPLDPPRSSLPPEHGQRRMRHSRRQALAAAVAGALEQVLGKAGCLDHERRGGVEADEVHGAVVGRAQRQVVVDAVHCPPMPWEPSDVGELMPVRERGHLLSEEVVIPLAERHRALEQRLYRQRHLASGVYACIIIGGSGVYSLIN